MQPSDVKIYTGEPERAFTEVRMIQAKISAGIGFQGKTPNYEDVNWQLQDTAARLGANAVIRVVYWRGAGGFSWNVLFARGVAIIQESDERDCPFCGERIKRKAVICRFCGRGVPAG